MEFIIDIRPDSSSRVVYMFPNTKYFSNKKILNLLNYLEFYDVIFKISSNTDSVAMIFPIEFIPIDRRNPKAGVWDITHQNLLSLRKYLHDKSTVNSKQISQITQCFDFDIAVNEYCKSQFK